MKPFRRSEIRQIEEDDGVEISSGNLGGLPDRTEIGRGVGTPRYFSRASNPAIEIILHDRPRLCSISQFKPAQDTRLLSIHAVFS